jgi:hypothetical membrane protein
MRLGKVVKRIAVNHPRLAPILFMSAIQYFLAQLATGQSFMPSYSLKYNTISDLGNTTCDVFNGRMICSPLHSLMNVSFCTLSIAMIIGSLLFYNRFDMHRSSRVGFSLFGLGGFGVLLVGLFPENTIPILHGIGAALPFLVGNIGVVVISYRLNMPKILRFYTLLSGIVALIALVLYTTSHFVGLGEGGIERVVAYPQTLWMIVIGVRLYFVRGSGKLEHT